MIDKNAILAIIIDATLLNSGPEKEPGTGVLSHFAFNQIILGEQTTRQIISLLFNGVATTNSNRCSNRRVVFLLTENERADSSADTREPALTKANPEVAMANNDFTFPLSDGQNFTHLSEAELSALLDLVTSQIEYHRDELTRLKPILHRLQAQIPTDAFRDFLETL